MPENDFKTAEDLLKYARRLQEKHDGRIRQHIELQNMWRTPVRRNAEGTRTLYINNEPWTATRLTVALVNQGKLTFKGSMPPNALDSEERNSLIGDVERFLKAHYSQVDVDLSRRTRGQRFRESLTYYMAVYGWHAGINLVQDASDQWPIFTDLWSPMDTFPEMDGGSGIVHATMMTKYEIEKTFGKKRGSVDKKMKAVPGYAANFTDDGKDDYDKKYAIYEYWDSETTCVIQICKGEPTFLKKQMEHEIGHNPAWCSAVNPAPFRHGTVDRFGALLTSPDAESNEWLEYYGQSPMLGYKSAYQYMCELANQVADVVEKWAQGPIAYLETPDGRYVPFDITGADVSTVPPGTKLTVVEIPKFPNDDKAWLAFVQQDIEKASYPRVAYGTVGSTEAAYTLQLLKTASGYIIEPLVHSAEFVYEQGALSILRQMEKRGGQYEGRFFPVRGTEKREAPVYDFVDVSKFPLGCYVTAELKGAGVPADKLAVLAAVTQAANQNNKVLSIETLLDQYMDVEDPSGEMSRSNWETMTTSPEVMKVMAPIATGFAQVNKLRARSKHPGDPAALIADAIEAQVRQGLNELAQSVKGQTPGGATPPGAPGAAPDQGQAPLESASGMPNQPVPPPAGVAGPPTGTNPNAVQAQNSQVPGPVVG